MEHKSRMLCQEISSDIHVPRALVLDDNATKDMIRVCAIISAGFDDPKLMANTLRLTERTVRQAITKLISLGHVQLHTSHILDTIVTRYEIIDQVSGKDVIFDNIHARKETANAA
jgi:hypothetical protein